MLFPTHWSRHEFTARDASGHPVTRTALGWSYTSQAEADEHARQRAQRAAAGEIDGTIEQYEYGHVPPREPVIDSIDLHGQTIAVITRNRYGCRVLNTDRVLFADIDLPLVEEIEPGFFAKLKRMAGQRKLVPASDAETIARIEAWHRDRPETSMRVYRTFAGIRLLFTDRQYDPTDPAVSELLESLGSDRLYMQLTQRQQTFRARLSPKPWRCGMPAAPHGSKIDDPNWEQRIKQWAVSYEPRAREFATCRMIQRLGEAARDPVIEAIIALHDRDTLSGNRPLA